MQNIKKCTRLALLATVGLVVGSLSHTANAGDKKGPGQKIESKKQITTTAASVNFSKDLELEFPTLATLGARIDAARNVADPIALAAAGNELAVAERVSGKMSSLKSADLLKEAAELAKIRFNPNELKAVSYLTGDKDLMTVAQKADKVMQDNIKARAAGESTRGIQGTLHVDSRVQGIWINVYVDGRYVGNVSPYGDSYFYIGQTPWETTFLSARSAGGSLSWNNAVRNAVGDFVWTLYP